MNTASSKVRSRVSNFGLDKRPRSHGEKEKNIWSSMLDSVASGRKLPEKQLLVLGGSPEMQKDFLNILESDGSSRPQDKRRRKPSVANEFALGYTYQDVLDADHDEILARLSIYMLPECTPNFSSLLKSYLTPRIIPETLLIVLLDWAEPWHWVRQLRNWIRFLKSVMTTLDSDCKEAIEENMNEWQLRRRGGGSLYDPAASGAAREGNINIPLSQGEWDEPLGLPICVVCHGIDKIDTLEREQSWKEEEFDFVLQYLRTILLKHGASLIYTSNSAPNSLPLLIHSSLGIHSLLKRDTFRHNIIDREKIIVPPNWDSWGKIRVLREGFDVEAISKGWSIDIQQPSAEPSSPGNQDQPPSSDADSSTRAENVARPQSPEQHGAVLQIYEETILNPDRDQPSTAPPIGEVKPELSVPSMQDFLRSQLEAITKSNDQEQKEFTKDNATASPSNPSPPPSSSITETDGRVNQHIGPVQFNMGGIQVDADDMVKKLKERGQTAAAAPGTPEGTKAQNEELASFFAGLMKRTRDSPRAGSGTPSKEPRS